MEPIWQRNRPWNCVSVQWKSNSYAGLEGFIFYVSQRRKDTLNECSCLLLLELPSASGWFQICRFPDDPDFRISGFPYFRVSTFPVYVSTCIWPCRAGWIEGLFEVVALKSQFSDPKWDLPSWFSDSRANFHLWTVVLPSCLARNVTQFHLFWASDC